MHCLLSCKNTVVQYSATSASAFVQKGLTIVCETPANAHLLNPKRARTVRTARPLAALAHVFVRRAVVRGFGAAVVRVAPSVLQALVVVTWLP